MTLFKRIFSKESFVWENRAARKCKFEKILSDPSWQKNANGQKKLFYEHELKKISNFLVRSEDSSLFNDSYLSKFQIFLNLFHYLNLTPATNTFQ